MATQAIGPNQERWLTDLESGKWMQTHSRLCDDGAYCCLGVACEVFGVIKNDDGDDLAYGQELATELAPREIVVLLGLRSDSGHFGNDLELRGRSSLASANDNGATFAEIAAFCRAHPEAVFTEPR